VLFLLEIGLAAALAYAAVNAYRRRRLWLALGALLMLASIAVLATGLTSVDGSVGFLPPRPLVLAFVLTGCGVSLGIGVVSLCRRRWRAALVAGTVLLGFANLLFAAGNRIHPLVRLRQAHAQMVRVVVYDGATEEPIRNAEVRVFHPCVDPTALPTRTDAGGNAVVVFHILSHAHAFKGHAWQECILAQHALEVRAADYRPVNSNLAAYMDADSWRVDQSPLPALTRSVGLQPLSAAVADDDPPETPRPPEDRPRSAPADEDRQREKDSLLWLVPSREIVVAWDMAVFLTVIGLSRWPRAWLLCAVAIAWLFLLLPFPLFLWLE
jgi:hypothetical protein